jgi:hypothetical protein
MIVGHTERGRDRSTAMASRSARPVLDLNTPEFLGW